jgi:hypothetical protein
LVLTLEHAGRAGFGGVSISRGFRPPFLVIHHTVHL